MKFLLDQDVYALTTRFLRGLGHDVVTAAELGLARASDETRQLPTIASLSHVTAIMGRLYTFVEFRPG